MDFGARYHPSSDQLAIVDEVSSSLDELMPISRLHKSFQERADTWSSLEELGILGITLPEEIGGSGLGYTEQALITVALGRQLVSPAVIATMACAPALQQVLSGSRSNHATVAYRNGSRIIAVAETGAQFLLLRQEEQAFMFAAPLSIRAIDHELWSAELREVIELGSVVSDINKDLLRLRLLDAAVLAGIAEAALGMAVSYAQERQQFGRAIGSFQAVKHHCANMAGAARRARDLVGYAAIAMDDGRADAQLQVECAFLTAGSSALKNAGVNIQIHGGLGFSDEANPHLLLKRAQLYLAIGGGVESATNRIADIKSIW